MPVASDLITNRPDDDGAPQKLRGDDTTMVKVIEVLPCRCPQISVGLVPVQLPL